MYKILWYEMYVTILNSNIASMCHFPLQIIPSTSFIIQCKLLIRRLLLIAQSLFSPGMVAIAAAAISVMTNYRKI